jgi:arabinan endo-1,5-alpha-L-arabinosidase
VSRTFRIPWRTSLPALPSAVLLALLPSTAHAYPDPGRVTETVTVHDPTMLRGADGRYLLYGTGGGLTHRTSTDRVAFSSRPSWWTQYGSTEA